MANLANYTPIYVRTNGNNDTGNGSINNPFATAQKAFEYIYHLIVYFGSTDKYVIDCGAGNFGGVHIVNANASEWPSTIAVRGVNSKQSFLGNINGEKIDDHGRNIHLISDNSINIGNVSSPGHYAQNNAFSGGNIRIEDCIVGNISSNGGYSENDMSGAGGTILLINCVANNIEANSGQSNGTSGSNGGPGIVTLYRSDVKSINSNAGSSRTPGNGGAIFLYNSSANDINSIGTDNVDGFAGNGGNILLNSSRVMSVNTRAGILITGANTAQKGNITLIGYSIVPNTIIGNINATNLFQGYLINSN